MNVDKNSDLKDFEKMDKTFIQSEEIPFEADPIFLKSLGIGASCKHCKIGSTPLFIYSDGKNAAVLHLFCLKKYNKKNNLNLKIVSYKQNIYEVNN